MIMDAWIFHESMTDPAMTVYVVSLPLTGKSLVIHDALLTRLHWHTRICVKNVTSLAREEDGFPLAVGHVVIKSIKGQI
jgi:hypothetical protein